MTDESAFLRRLPIRRIIGRRSTYALNGLHYRNLLPYTFARRDEVLVVKERKWHQIEAKLDARSDHKIVEAHAGNFPGAVQVSSHLANVVRRSANVGEGENDHEALQAALLVRQPRSHHTDNQDQRGRLPDDEDDELNADEIVSEHHEEGGVNRLLTRLAIIRKEVKPEVIDR